MYTLLAEQILNVSIQEAWEFFSSPKNLSKITPPQMGFYITSEELKQMFAGQIITYQIRVFPFLKTNWVTEITQVKEQSYFVDEQRFGPYKMWHHEHHFSETEEGVKMIDRVTYKIPFGFIGKIAHCIFIKRKLEDIFSYRAKVLDRKFTVMNFK
ncbi:SRPBCC family protein [Maribellus maritimus]|nr:SRPBCC family protein [Maribellus maritimus]